MDRADYITTLQAALYELGGLWQEWLTDDGEYLDDEVNDELIGISIDLEKFIDKLKAKVAV